MMPEAVLRFFDDGNGGVRLLFDRAPAMVPDARRGSQFPCVPNEAPFQDLAQQPLPSGAARRAGERLFEGLSAEEAPRRVMQVVASHADPCPIYIDLSGSPPGTAALPWELLFNREQERFMALDRRWQVCRRLPSLHGDVPGVQPLPARLRLFVILSAAGIDATPEWRALSGALAELAGDRLGIEVRIAVCQDDLAQQLQGEIDGRGEVLYVEDTAQIRQAILAFRPHLVHFFCHGTVAHGPMLQLSSRADFVAAEHGLERRPVPFGVEDFEVLAAPPSPIWLVTLNACRSGETSEAARSLIEGIAGAGFPAVIGMREAVATEDAHVFTEAFYGTLFKTLSSLAGQPPGSELILDCAEFLLPARERLVHAHNQTGLSVTTAAEGSKEWSLPSLYVGAGPVRLRVPEPADAAGAAADETEIAIRQQLEILVQTRAALAGGPMPPAGVIARIDEQIQKLLGRLTE